VLKLIRAFLNAGVMEDGLVSPVDEGTPQGGPLSPILSNLATAANIDVAVVGVPAKAVTASGQFFVEVVKHAFVDKRDGCREHRSSSAERMND
jgi:hypothetical protein